jgi:hypothetical protein
MKMNTEQTNETITGFCDICGNQETGTADNLQSEGWYLGSREHFCPNCND